MRKIPFVLVWSFLFAGCLGEPVPEQEQRLLFDARANFKSKLVPNGSPRSPAPEPPPEIFRKVYYNTPAGKLAAYVSQVPDDGEKRPAIVWITESCPER